MNTHIYDIYIKLHAQNISNYLLKKKNIGLKSTPALCSHCQHLGSGSHLSWGTNLLTSPVLPPLIQSQSGLSQTILLCFPSVRAPTEYKFKLHNTACIGPP